MKVESRKKKAMGEPKSKNNYKNLDEKEENIMDIPYSSDSTETHEHRNRNMGELSPSYNAIEKQNQKNKR